MVFAQLGQKSTVLYFFIIKIKKKKKITKKYYNASFLIS